MLGGVIPLLLVVLSLCWVVCALLWFITSRRVPPKYYVVRFPVKNLLYIIKKRFQKKKLTFSVCHVHRLHHVGGLDLHAGQGSGRRHRFYWLEATLRKQITKQFKL